MSEPSSDSIHHANEEQPGSSATTDKEQNTNEQPTSSEVNNSTSSPSQPNAQDDEDDNSEEFALLVQKAEEFKVEGNKCFTNAAYDKAIDFYNETLKIWFVYLDKEDELKVRTEDVKKLTNIVVDTYNNAAVTLMKLNNFVNAYKAAAMANRFMPNAKSYYLQGKCLFSLGQAFQAKSFLEQCLELQPNNKEARDLLDECADAEPPFLDYGMPFGGMGAFSAALRQKQQEEEEMKKAMEESLRIFEEEQRKRDSEQKKADEEQEKIRQAFELQQQELKKKQEEEEKRRLQEEEEVEFDIEIEHEDGEVEEDEVSLTESEIEEQMRLLELEEKGQLPAEEE
ncbi:hypothetical protein C9374_006884 [Naegleria lovaniensis]|uniref:Uncharacterized protein n=1 Tax=Naegleria lovaniensis TaxID=51637 RepID=A0AA88KPN5_NAELO|nr:uncharacterized protein C9374_006884 [Naegleria lovaniensis]KAG2393353.1 hypothetical protein C9374_006884 [Naegleria lovaniensis]